MDEHHEDGGEKSGSRVPDVLRVGQLHQRAARPHEKGVRPLAMAFTHVAGLLIVPTVIALLVSAFTDAEQPRLVSAASRPDPQGADQR
jgi:hypothetical protein